MMEYLLPSLIAGLACAIGGAWKDSRYEGFKWLTFPRSIYCAVLGALLPYICGIHGFMPIAAMSGYCERCLVEGYKILRGKKPGKFVVLDPGPLPPGHYVEADQ